MNVPFYYKEIYLFIIIILHNSIRHLYTFKWVTVDIKCCLKPSSWVECMDIQAGCMRGDH